MSHTHAVTYFDHFTEHQNDEYRRRVVYIVSYENGLEYSVTDNSNKKSGTVDEGNFVKIDNRDFAGPIKIELSNNAGYAYGTDERIDDRSDDAITLIRGRNELVDTEFYFYNPIENPEWKPRVVITSLADNNSVKLTNIKNGEQKKISRFKDSSNREINSDKMTKGSFTSEILANEGMFRVESTGALYLHFGIMDNDFFETVPSLSGNLVGTEFYATSARQVVATPLESGGNITIKTFGEDNDPRERRWDNVVLGESYEFWDFGGGHIEMAKVAHVTSTVPVYVTVGKDGWGDSMFLPPHPNTDSTQFFTFQWEASLKIFALADNTQVDILDHDSPIRSVSGQLKAGEMLITGSNKRIWRVSSGTEVRSNKPIIVKLVYQDWDYENSSAAYLVPADFNTSLLFIDAPQASESPSVGEKFTVSISTLNQVALRDFSFNFSFDPLAIKAESVEYGDFLSQGNVDPTTCETPDIDNGSGLINSISCRRNPATGVTGAGKLIAISFEAVASGKSKLQLQSPEFFQPSQEPIEFSFPDEQVNVLLSRGQITGKVTTGSGIPVPHIAVEAFLEGKQIGTSAKTNSLGIYIIDNILQAGLVEVRAFGPGMLPIPSIEVEVAIGSETESADFLTVQTTALQSVTDYRGFIRNWLMLGAIDWENSGTLLMADQLNPKTKPGARFPVQETEFKEIDPKDGDYGTGLAKHLRWALHVDPRENSWELNDHRIRPYELYPHQEQAVVYAFTHVKAPADMKVNMELEHYGVAIWLNGEYIHMNSDSKCCWDPSSDWYPDIVKDVTLKKGWNSILIKTSRGELSCRFTSKSSLFGEAEPLTNLPVAPQLGSTTTSIDQPQPVALTRGTFNLKLEKGLNMISLPVKPDQPMTSKALAKELDATLVIRLDPKNETFVPFVPDHFEGYNFTIEGGMGLIVNVKRSQTSTFTGTVWDNTNAAPIVPVDPQSVWAFGLVFDNLLTDSTLIVRNLRSGQTLQSLTGTPAIAFVDQSQQSVVHPQDWIEIQTENTRWRYRVTGQDLQQAFAVVSLNKQIQIPNQTRLLQNYPNPFNPETWIPFQLSQDSQVVVSVFGVKGNLVRRLDLGWMIAGNYLEANRAIYWDGKSETGETVASGTYFYQIATGDYSEIRQMVILK